MANKELRFEEIERLLQQVKQLETVMHCQPTEIKDILKQQRSLNLQFVKELTRLREEFTHFKLHTIAHIDGSGTEDIPPKKGQMKCASNPFQLYDLAQ